MDQRADLGQTFGTKKTKKAIEDRARNALTPRKSDHDTPGKLDIAAKAMMSEIGEATATMATREELQAVADAAKPVPKANTSTGNIADVYDPNVIIGKDILNSIQIQAWLDASAEPQGLRIASSFVARRLNKVVANERDGISRLRLLRYIWFLITFYNWAGRSREKGAKQSPNRKQLRELLRSDQDDTAVFDGVIESIRRKFSDHGVMRKFHIDLLLTHLCALACVVDSWEVEIWDLQQDLKMDEKTIIGYFRQIGARMKKHEDKNRTWQVAQLMLPLDLPQQRTFRQKRRG